MNLGNSKVSHFSFAIPNKRLVGLMYIEFFSLSFWRNSCGALEVSTLRIRPNLRKKGLPKLTQTCSKKTAYSLGMRHF